MSIEFVITSIVVILLPGTGVLYTLAIGVGRGFRPSIAAAFGCTSWHFTGCHCRNSRAGSDFSHQRAGFSGGKVCRCGVSFLHGLEHLARWRCSGFFRKQGSDIDWKNHSCRDVVERP